MSSDPVQEAHVQELFAAAQALSGEVRRDFLDRACMGNPTLRAEVEGLLSAYAEAGTFLAAPAADVREVAGADPQVGTVVDRYRLLERIGEGGFAMVYRAEQQVPVRREVALKFVKLGMDTGQVIARFDVERQALAILDHPNICRVFDAGATATGRPYFAMELVRGLPVTEYCDRHGLSPRQRLELFIPICQAVQHAHQKGIIHRDIKPNNILVFDQDGKPVPKVIDFGVAKATQAQLAERTLFTGLGQFIGTPAYMSPEQAGLAATDIDTRSDIYSLGVLLYELLTGTTPIEGKVLRAAAYDQMQKLIREFEPPAPSTRITAMGDAVSSIAAVRRVEPNALSRTIRGEIDWIVMRCLEKDRARRYESAGALWTDIGSHLSGDIVAASPPGAAYRVRKFARRNRVALGVTSAVACSLVGALAIALVALAREKRARVLAQEANESATAVTNYAISRSLGDPRAEPLFRQAYDRLRLAYGPDHPMSINAQRNVGQLLTSQGRFADAETILRDCLERSRRVMGTCSRTTILTLSELSNCYVLNQRLDEALRVNVELDVATKDPRAEPMFRLGFCTYLGGCLTVLHRYAEARQPLLDALALLKANNGPREHIRGVMINLAEGCEALGEREQAAKWRRDIEAYQGTPATRPGTSPGN